MNREDVMDKLKKLMSLSQSSNEHEAALAAQRAAELMARHQIEAAEFHAHVGHTDEPTTPESGRIDAEEESAWGKREEAWKAQLADALATNLGGKMWRQYGHKIFRFFMIGPPDSIAAARYLYMALEAQIRRLGQVEMRKRGESNAWRRAYQLGMVLNVSSRLKQGRETVISTSTAMVHVSRMNEAVEEVYAAMELKHSKGGQLKRADATSDGYRDGAQLDISSAPGRKGLGEGHRRLKN